MTVGEPEGLWFVFAAASVFAAWLADEISGMNRRLADIDKRTSDMAYQMGQMQRTIESISASVDELERNSHP